MIRLSRLFNDARRERQAHFEAELDEFFPCDKDNE